MFVGAVVAADDMNLLFNGHSLVDHAQELEPFLAPVGAVRIGGRSRRSRC
jgi:hypothetical protein